MPRYYFDIYSGNNIVSDPDGQEMTGIEAARLEAVEALPDIARMVLFSGDEQTLTAVVRTEDGQPVYKAILSLSTEVIN
jgi:hypothetical protein